MSGPSLSDGRVCTDEVIFAENEGRKVFPAGALHSADLARTQEQQELGMRSHARSERPRAAAPKKFGRGGKEGIAARLLKTEHSQHSPINLATQTAAATACGWQSPSRWIACSRRPSCGGPPPPPPLWFELPSG